MVIPPLLSITIITLPSPFSLHSPCPSNKGSLVHLKDSFRKIPMDSHSGCLKSRKKTQKSRRKLNWRKNVLVRVQMWKKTHEKSSNSWKEEEVEKPEKVKRIRISPRPVTKEEEGTRKARRLQEHPAKCSAPDFRVLEPEI